MGLAILKGWASGILLGAIAGTVCYFIFERDNGEGDHD